MKLFKSKKKEAENIENQPHKNDPYRKAIEFEATIAEMNEKSKRVAWIVASFFGFLLLLAIVALIALIPLKEKEPMVAVVDKYTGYVEVLTRIKENDLTASEALNKYWAQTYVKQYEEYNYSLIPTNYERVSVWSSPEVREQYQHRYDENRNPNAIQKVMGRKKEIKVKIISITPMSPSIEKTENGDELRAITMALRIEKDITEGNKVLRSSRGVVTMSFVYNTEVDMNETARNLNPLGLQVLAYRYDPEQVK